MYLVYCTSLCVSERHCTPVYVTILYVSTRHCTARTLCVMFLQLRQVVDVTELVDVLTHVLRM